MDISPTKREGIIVLSSNSRECWSWPSYSQQDYQSEAAGGAHGHQKKGKM